MLSGSAFYADPVGWVLRDDIPVTNANVICMGKPGTGKSATTKAFCLRMTDFGYRILVLGDPKDEYERLCHFFGVQPFVLGPGMPARINPLGLGPLGHGWANLSAQQAQSRAAVVFSRWLTLVRALVGSQRIGHNRVPFGPSEEVVVKAALADLTGYTAGNSTLTETTIPRLWHHLDQPTDTLIEQCRYASTQHFFDETRLLRDALGQLVSGALAGLFDEHTTIDVDWNAPIQSLSLSRLGPLGDEAIGIALVCLNSWGRGMREIAAPGDLRVVVRDEMWKAMRLGVEAVKSLDEDLRLSRGVAGRGGDIQWANAHKPSDMLTVGDHGSQAANIARDLMHLADIKILHGQKPGVANELDAMLGLGRTSHRRHDRLGHAPQGPRPVAGGGGGLQDRNPAPPRRGDPHLDKRGHRRGGLTPEPRGGGHSDMKKLTTVAAGFLALLIAFPLHDSRVRRLQHPRASPGRVVHQRRRRRPPGSGGPRCSRPTRSPHRSANASTRSPA